MPSVREKMLAGALYDPLDPELVAGRERARDLCQALNATREGEADARRAVLRELFGRGGDTVWMHPPFFCDYGTNIELGERVFFNFNCVVLDVCRGRIGDYTLFGPGVQILARVHPMNAELRRREEYGKPIEIGGTCGSAARRSSWRASGSGPGPSSAPAASSRKVPDGDVRRVEPVPESSGRSRSKRSTRCSTRANTLQR